MRKRLIILSIGIVIIALFGVRCSGGGSEYVQDGVYSFSFTDLNGNELVFEDLRGKGVMVNIWATWCGPCKDEIPVFIELYEEYKDRGIEFWGIATDVQGKDIVQPYVEEAEVNYPILLGDLSKVKSVFSYLRGHPTTLFFDAEGRLVHRIDGQPPVDHSKEGAMKEFFERQFEKILPEGN